MDIHRFLDTYEEYIEKTIAMSFQGILMLIILTIIRIFLNANTEYYSTIVIVLLLCFYQLYFDQEMYSSVRQDSLNMLYQTRIQGKELSEFDYSLLSYEFLYFLLPLRLFICFSKKFMIPILIIITLLSIVRKKEIISTTQIS